MTDSDPMFDEFPDLSRVFGTPSLDDWRRAAEASLKGRPLDKLTIRTHEGLAVGPLFTAADAAADPGYPGLAPHTRGRTPLGPGADGWSVSAELAHPDPGIAARWAAEEIGRGADAVLLVVDRAVRAADGEPAATDGDGVHLVTVADAAPLVEGLAAAGAALHLDAGGAAPAVAATLVAAGRRQRPAHDVRGALCFDPIAALVRDGVLVAGLDGAYDQLAELAVWADRHAPGLRSAGVDTLPYHLAGASAVEELAWGLATAVQALRELASRGVAPDAACRQLSVRFAIGRDLFTEAAKLRAWRRLWSRAAGACGVAEPERPALLHAIASPRGLTTRDPWVNMLRTTVGAFAAAVGGADVVTVLAFDRAAGPPDDLGRRMATNSQTILREESHLGRVIDPGGGSWYLEWLTDELAELAWRRFQGVEARGGMAAVVLDGSLAGELAELQAARDRALATRRDPVTGVSSFPNLAERPLERPPATAPPPATDGGAAEELGRLHAAARAPLFDGQLVETAIAAATAGAGVGRIVAALADGAEPTRVGPLPRRREADAIERLRDASDAWLEENGSRPRIFLANLGPVADHKPRAAFAVGFFEAGGIEALDNPGFATPAEAAAAFAGCGARMAVICSSDERYPEIVPELAAALEAAGARTVLLAGRPGEHEAAWREAGVAGFVHIGSDQVRTLADLLREEGVLHV
ncbi:MAG: methylmalonyl-CoA mutase family protein [Thermoanaerobaculales bacterium]|jgi:methylmalonyl-CoA mutase|nr:methylmalonyl-CoA mutase family protein [Thermoanaerobaculales bacterium]